MPIPTMRRSRAIPIKVKRTGVLAVAFAGIAVWLVAGATQPPRSPVRHPVPVPPRDASLAVEITRLHQPRQSGAPPLRARDLFRYVPKTPRVAIAPHAESLGEQVLPASIPAPANLSLAGLAEDEGADGPVRTAIISGAGKLFLVKDGEPVTDRYKVAMISSDHVELTDVVNGTVLRLGLR